jgi:7-cyano-7-deazaguanine synthase
MQPIDDMHCGRCNKCAERRLGFRLAGVEDPSVYAVLTQDASLDWPGNTTVEPAL